jgi:hypothetical protein
MTAAPAAQEEVYISVDVEAAGPIPATYSLLSLGASVVSDPMQHFYAEFQPINDNVVPAAMAVSGFSLMELAKQGEAPAAAMRRFHDWITAISEGRTPVFVGFNAGFDWAFVNWYFHTYLGENPLRLQCARHQGILYGAVRLPLGRNDFPEIAHRISGNGNDSQPQCSDRRTSAGRDFRQATACITHEEGVRHAYHSFRV